MFRFCFGRIWCLRPFFTPFPNYVLTTQIRGHRIPSWCFPLPDPLRDVPCICIAKILQLFLLSSTRGESRVPALRAVDLFLVSNFCELNVHKISPRWDSNPGNQRYVCTWYTSFLRGPRACWPNFHEAFSRPFQKAHHPHRAHGGVEGRVPNPREPLGGSPQGGLPPERDPVRWRESLSSEIVLKVLANMMDACWFWSTHTTGGWCALVGCRESFWQSISSR